VNLFGVCRVIHRTGRVVVLDLDTAQAVLDCLEAFFDDATKDYGEPIHAEDAAMMLTLKHAIRDAAPKVLS
jgi:hypothetical protein